MPIMEANRGHVLLIEGDSYRLRESLRRREVTG